MQLRFIWGSVVVCFALLASISTGCGSNDLKQRSDDATYLKNQSHEHKSVFIAYFSHDTLAYDLRGRSCFFHEGSEIRLQNFEGESEKWLEIYVGKPLRRCHESRYFKVHREHIEIRSAPRSVESFHSDQGLPWGYYHVPHTNTEDFYSEYISGATQKQHFFPLAELPLADYTIEGRGFGAPRDGGIRKHAANDLLEYAGRGVFAVTSGEIIDYYYFYEGTDAVVVDHKDFVVRYGEVGSLWKNLKIKSTVYAGEKIAVVGTLWGGSSMLHFEKYTGELSGQLTVSYNYPFKRRADLVNPTPFLRHLENHLP